MPPSVTEVGRIDLSCGHFDALRAEHFVHRFPPHFHDTFAIGVVEEGTAHIRTQRGEWLAQPGSILAFSPGEIHAADSSGAGGYTYRMVYPSREVMREIAAFRSSGDDRVPVFRTPVIDDAEVAHRLLDAHEPLMAGKWRGRAESKLVAGLRSLLERHGTFSDEASSVRPLDLEVSGKARDYLHERWSKPLRLSAVAQECGTSTFHLIRSFRRVMGVPPYAYLVQLRVNRAQAMLCAGSSVSDVAYACGFCDQSHLNRMFKKAVGVPPGQYVRQTGLRVS